MTTKRIPFQASTLCATGTLLVLGGFLALNLAGCGGGGGGGIGNPTPLPGTTPTAVPASIQFVLQLTDGVTATGGRVTLTSASGRSYNGTANNRGIVSINNVIPGLYTLVFAVNQPNGNAPVSTTRSITITSPTTSGVQTFVLRQGDTGNSNPFTVSGKVLLNPIGAGVDPDNNSSTPNCAAVPQPLTDAVVITVRDLNSTNGTPIIATVTRPAQSASTPATDRGAYSITLPYQPRSFIVEARGAGDAPYAGLSARTSFPTTGTTVANVDVCTNEGNTAPQPVVTAVPTGTPFLTSTPVGTPVATGTSTPVPNPTATTAAPTATPTTAAPTATPTLAPGQNPTATPTSTLQPAGTN